MKKILSLILAIAMVISLVPSVFADDTATAPKNVVYDFSTLTTITDDTIDTLGFAISGGGTYGQKTDSWKTGLDISKKQVGLRVAVNAQWETEKRRSDKAAINIKVTESGWYTPSFTGGLTAIGFKASIYLVENDTNNTAKAKHYLGDYDFTYDGDETTSNEYCVVGTEKKLNSVYLEAGTHTVVFCFRSGKDGSYPFFVNFKLYGLSAEPTILRVDSDVPTEILNIGDETTPTAQVVDSNENAISYADYAVEGNVVKGSENTTNYLKVTSDNEDIIKVTSYAKGGLCNSENTTYTFGAVGGGVANLVFTPYIDGAAQTSYTKSVSVAGPITIDFSKTTNNAASTPGYTLSSAGQISGNWKKSVDGKMTRIILSGGWPSANGQSRRIIFTVAVPEAGFYNIGFQGGLSQAGATGYVYVNGSYAGDYNFWTADTSTSEISGIEDDMQTLNTVWLDKGENTVFIPIKENKSTYYTNDTQNSALVFLRKLTFTPVELNGDTISISDVVSSDIPSEMVVGNTADATATVTMEDGSVRRFAEYMLGGNYAGNADTYDSVTITSSAPEVISVESYDDDAFGASDKTTFTLRANAAGSADITVTAKVGESTKTATYTVTVPDEKPGETITDTTVGFKASAYEGGTVDKTDVQEVEIGKSVTVTATPNTGYTFAYWKNSAGVVLSTSATETFKVSTNMGVIAVFDEIPTDDAIPVYFYNGNGILLKETTVAKDTTFAGAKTAAGVPAIPTLTGYVFSHWSDKDANVAIEDTALITALTRAVAIYKDDEAKTYTVSVTGKEPITGKKYGDPVTVNGSDSFVCWKLGDKVISYDKDYTFDVYGNVTLTEVTEGESEKAPVLVLDKVDGNYFLTYDEGDYELIEAGILFGSDGVSIKSIDGYKAAAKKGTGQFTAQPHEDATSATIARGYMIFRDGTDLRVAYSD